MTGRVAFCKKRGTRSHRPASLGKVRSHYCPCARTSKSRLATPSRAFSSSGPAAKIHAIDVNSAAAWRHRRRPGMCSVRPSDQPTMPRSPNVTVHPAPDDVAVDVAVDVAADRDEPDMLSSEIVRDKSRKNRCSYDIFLADGSRPEMRSGNRLRCQAMNKGWVAPLAPCTKRRSSKLPASGHIARRCRSVTRSPWSFCPPTSRQFASPDAPREDMFVTVETPKKKNKAKRSAAPDGPAEHLEALAAQATGGDEGDVAPYGHFQVQRSRQEACRTARRYGHGSARAARNGRDAGAGRASTPVTKLIPGYFGSQRASCRSALSAVWSSGRTTCDWTSCGALGQLHGFRQKSQSALETLIHDRGHILLLSPKYTRKSRAWPSGTAGAAAR